MTSAMSADSRRLSMSSSLIFAIMPLARAAACSTLAVWSAGRTGKSASS
jgi:hypothetical protein